MQKPEKMIGATTIEGLQISIDKMIKKGWEPIGDIIEDKPAVDIGVGSRTIYLQKVIKVV